MGATGDSKAAAQSPTKSTRAAQRGKRRRGNKPTRATNDVEVEMKSRIETTANIIAIVFAVVVGSMFLKDRLSGQQFGGSTQKEESGDRS